jgi:4-hydroxy-3-methylbut-2-enyl diphosphate reductase
MLMEIVRDYPPPIYVNHEIIHNAFVVDMFKRKWVIFENDINKIPPWSLVVISAHGTGPTYFSELRKKQIRWIDATCPLVEKVHREARDFIEKWYHILYIGKEWHQEAIGVIDEWEKYFTLIENEEDIKKLIRWYSENGGSGVKHCLSDDENLKTHEQSEKERVWFTPETFDTFGHESMEEGVETMNSSHVQNNTREKLALLTQTTLSIDDTAKLIEKILSIFPNIILPKAWDICYATTNRQKAVKSLAEEVDLILVVWSKNSSNSSKLRHVAEEMGKKAYLIDTYEDIDIRWFQNINSVWVTSGASWPEELVEGVISYLQSIGWTFEKELRIIEEKVEFPYTLKIQS